MSLSAIMDWFYVYFTLTACFILSYGHRHHYKQLRQEMRKQREELKLSLDSLKNDLLSDIDNMLNTGAGNESLPIFIEKTVVDMVENEISRAVSDIGMSYCNNSQEEYKRIENLVKDSEEKINSYKIRIQKTYESMIDLWYECRNTEKQVERLSSQVKECECPADNRKPDSPNTMTPTYVSRENSSGGAFGLVIADENSDNFTLLYLKSKQVRTLKSGRRNVTAIVYNHLDGRLYYSLPESIWTSYLNGGGEVRLRNCTGLCIKVNFDPTLTVLQYIDYNVSTRGHMVCDVHLHNDNGETDCEDRPHFPFSILRRSSFAMNMKDRTVALAAYDGGKVHGTFGYFNITSLHLNGTVDRLLNSGKFYEIDHSALKFVDELYASPDGDKKSREVITRVPTIPSSLTVDGKGRRVFISYETRDVLDVFDLDTDALSMFTKIDKQWDVGRQMCLIN